MSFCPKTRAMTSRRFAVLEVEHPFHLRWSGKPAAAFDVRKHETPGPISGARLKRGGIRGGIRQFTAAPGGF
jgi:hypothetical protein